MAPAPAAAAPIPMAPEPAPADPPADRFALDEEPPDSAAQPSPRVIGSSPAASATPTPAPTDGKRPTSPPPASRVAAAARNSKAFWQDLVVAAVSAGKSADEAVQLANRVVDAAPN